MRTWGALPEGDEPGGVTDENARIHRSRVSDRLGEQNLDEIWDRLVEATTARFKDKSTMDPASSCGWQPT